MLQCIGKICVLGAKLVNCLLAFLFVYKGFISLRFYGAY